MTSWGIKHVDSEEFSTLCVAVIEWTDDIALLARKVASKCE